MHVLKNFEGIMPSDTANYMIPP